jgi:uncharacterized protein (TIGR00375 family)
VHKLFKEFYSVQWFSTESFLPLKSVLIPTPVKFIADLHIHSHYSIATSKELAPEYLDYWARIKGIGIVATGDFTHPKWIVELKEKLKPAEPGLFKLKPELRLKLPFQNADIENRDVRFVLSSEISSIYKKNDKVRKVHNLLYAPDFETVEKMQFELSKIGNITSDGRPIFGLDSRNLLELALNVSPDIFFVPAHIWTPWFSVLGEKGGFDSIEECFGDLSQHIYALETGLSTNPALNWMCSFLDRYTLLSNSDAHSPDRLGRNSNILDCEFDYTTIFNAIKNADGKSFIGTIDLFPQEGKYHYDGHRKCNVCWNPVETLRNRAICPVCGKRVVIGVTSRIAQLSDRTDISLRPNRREFQSIIPLPEILSEIVGAGESSKKVKQLYFHLLQKCGSEFDILLNHSAELIDSTCGPVVGEAIRRMRNGQVLIKEGFDGEYGIIKVFQPGEHKLYEAGEKLFSVASGATIPPARPLLNFDLKEYRKLVEENYAFEGVEEKQEEYAKDWLSSFNPDQKKAVIHHTGPALILAGPGTGKTRVLTSRISYLIKHFDIDPANILAITFTNKAASEIRERLSNTLDANMVNKITVSTFHALGLQVLKDNIAATRRSNNVLLAGDYEKINILKKITGKSERDCKVYSSTIEKIKQNLHTEENIEDPEIKQLFIVYQEQLQKANAFDLEDLIYWSYLLFQAHPEIALRYQKQYPWVLIDEYQDVNFAQYQWMKLLLGKENGNIFAIGDPNQAIYGFRGSDVAFINRFTEDYPDSEVYRLKKSYRCTDRILQASTQVLNIITNNEPLNGVSRGLKIRIDTHPDDRTEALFIARTIDELMGGMQFHTMDRGLKTKEDNEVSGLSDIAVLCRTRLQMKILEQIFSDKNIPYQVVGSEAFFNHEPYKSIVDALYYIESPENTLIQDLLKDKRLDLNRFSGLKSTAKSVAELIESIAEQLPVLNIDKKDYTYRHFVALAGNFGNNLPDFLYSCKLGIGIDGWAQKADRVSLMTIHASKGLEFECVFIPGCEEGIIPYTLYKENTDMEEEIRLLYVGMTRASKYLYLSHTMRRTINNRELKLSRSSFLNQIENNLFELSAKEKRKQKPTDNQLKLF